MIATFLVHILLYLKFFRIWICFNIWSMRIFLQSKKWIICVFFYNFYAFNFLCPICFIWEFSYFVLGVNIIFFLYIILYLSFLFYPLNMLQIYYYLFFKWGSQLLNFRTLFLFLKFNSFGVLCFSSNHYWWYVLVYFTVYRVIYWHRLL